MTSNNLIYPQVNQEWIARYNGIGNSSDEALDIEIDNLGNSYITGQSTRIAGTSNTDFVTIKYNSNGVKQWVAEYNGSGNDNDYGKAIAIDNSGNIFVTGWSKGIATEYDYATIKYNSSGIQQWAARFNGSRNSSDQANSIVVDASGNVYVTGGSINDVNNQEDIITIKYSSSGIPQWIGIYNSENWEDIGFAVKLDENNNVYVTGSSDGDFITLKYNTEGIQQWASTYDGIIHSTDESKYLVLDDSGNVYVSGLSVGSMFYEDFALVKYNSFGIQQWVRRYDGSAHFIDKPFGLEIDKYNNIYISGYSAEINTGYDFTIIKYNSLGQQKWISSHNISLNDFARSMSIDYSGCIYVTGDSYQSNNGSDFTTIKFDSSGAFCWSMIYSSQGDSSDIPNAISVDNSGNVIVTGSSGTDYLTIKYSQLTGTNMNSTEIPSAFKLNQNYPNPFNPVTIISYSLIENRFVNLKIFNVLGDEVKTLVDKKQNAGSYEVEFDGNELPSGIYFYRLEIDRSAIDTKRMILLK